MQEANKGLEFPVFDNIYKASLHTLFCDIINRQINPAEIKTDPLHAMVDQTPEISLKNLQLVFQEFRLILLEDYKEFLVQVLDQYPTKLEQVVQNFYFLFPNYPFKINVQKPSKTNEPPIRALVTEEIQPNWFQEVTIAQWRTEMTKERIVAQFYDYFHTSRITESVDEFKNSLYGAEHKRWKHGLITLSLD